jgi:hypothetical protein
MVEPDETLNSNRRIFIPAYDEPRIKEAPAEWELVVNGAHSFTAAFEE